MTFQARLHLNDFEVCVAVRLSENIMFCGKGYICIV